MIDYKYREDELLSEFMSYIDTTYGQHYSKDKFQATEFIIDGGHGTGFCIGNVMKYAQRYGKKGSHADARKDLLKVLHYALIQLYIHDEEVNSLMDYPMHAVTSSKSDHQDQINLAQLCFQDQ
jgi:hypothetical protein